MHVQYIDLWFTLATDQYKAYMLWQVLHCCRTGSGLLHLIFSGLISEYIWSTTNPFLPSYYWHGRRPCRDMCPWRDDFGVLCPLLNILMYWRTQLAPGYMTYVMLGCWYWWKLTVWHWKLKIVSAAWSNI